MFRRLREMRLSRARVRARRHAADPAAATPLPTAVPDGAEKFRKQARDLDAARKVVEDAAAVSAGLWFSYLSLLLYLAIAVGSVTHKDLLLESPLRLPILNVDLPLVAFFVLAPFMFLVSHAYTLIHFVMLAQKAGALDDEVNAHYGDAPDTREGFRRQLPSNIFVQLLAGPGDIRMGGLGVLLSLIVWITLVLAPVLLLLLIQVQFLPYHNEAVTLWHRAMVLADVILLWALWPAVLESRSTITRPSPKRHPVLALWGLIAIGLAFTAITFPGERLEEWVGSKQWIPPNTVTAWLGARDLDGTAIKTSLHDLLVEGPIDERLRRRKSPFSNTLVLPGFDAPAATKSGDPSKLDSGKPILVLVGRRLEGVDFRNADLRKVELAGVRLQGANLRYAWLQGAWLTGVPLQGASLESAKLQGASLEKAQLSGASLKDAQLQGAWLFKADVRGASLEQAQLQNTSLKDARLEGTSLKDAKLQGADFRGSKLEGSDLSGAELACANFSDASATTAFRSAAPESKLSPNQADAVSNRNTQEVPEGTSIENALKRGEKLKPDAPCTSEIEASREHALEAAGAVDLQAYQIALADELKSLACSGDSNAAYALRGFIANDRIPDTGKQAARLVDDILKPDCPVSSELTEQDRATLKKLATGVQASESKQ
jgi:uncharacterized protein YjbI with pentapeptide repeats